MIWFALLLNSATAQIVDPIKVSAQQFCQNLKAESKFDGVSFAKALKTNERLNSEQMTDSLHELGFNNMLEDDSNLFKDLKKIPAGAIFVLTCKAPLSVKCGGELLLPKKKTMKLNELDIKCVRSVMYTGDWKTTKASP